MIENITGTNLTPMPKINTQQSAYERALSKMQADETNKKKGVGDAETHGKMGKDDFLKLLVAQLRHQDPTKPMEDREFIAQMAQFSSLEQMTNMNREMTNLFQSQKSTEAFNLLGKTIDSFDPVTNRRVTGTVSSIQYRNDELKLMVNGSEVSMSMISAVHMPEEKKSQLNEAVVIQNKGK